MFRMTGLALALFAGMIGVALAGEQYVDRTGFAASGYDVVSYFDLPQAPVGEPQQAPLAGRATITADYNGATFAFATAANRDRFLADPATFAPQYDGHCAYGVTQGSKVPANPTLWRIVDGKLYLNITDEVVASWEEDIHGNLALAAQNWAALEPERASRRRIPGFRSTAPVAN